MNLLVKVFLFVAIISFLRLAYEQSAFDRLVSPAIQKEGVKSPPPIKQSKHLGQAGRQQQVPAPQAAVDKARTPNPPANPPSPAEAPTNKNLSSSLDAMEHVTAAESIRGFIDDSEHLCAELLVRANGTQEGKEPWRERGGLLYTTNDCMKQGSSVLGNHLSRWYMMRAIASKAGITINATCHSKVTDEIPQLVMPSDTVIDGDALFSWKSVCKTCSHSGHCKYPHGERKDALDRVATTIRYDLQNMTDRVLQRSPKLADDIDDISIHMRSGDTLRQDNRLYGLVPFHVYTKLIPSDAKTIGIITAPFKQDRWGWGPGDADLNQAVVTAARNYLQRALPKAKISIRNDDQESMDEVYARMVASKQLICAASTFCLFPAIATTGESYILRSPLLGGSPTWVDTLSEYFPQVHYVDEKYVLAHEFFEWNVTEIVQMLEDQEPSDEDHKVDNESGTRMSHFNSSDISNSSSTRVNDTVILEYSDVDASKMNISSLGVDTLPRDFAGSKNNSTFPAYPFLATPNFPSNNYTLPNWSISLPKTRFTSDILETILDLTTPRSKICTFEYPLIVNNSESNTPSIPVVLCDPDDFWCQTLKRIFQSRPLPYNVTLGIVKEDFFYPTEQYGDSCLGNSSPKGRLCVPNMEQLQIMNRKENVRIRNPEQWRYEYRDTVPWTERDPIPIFRGTAWKLNGRDCVEDGANLTYAGFLEFYPIRFRAVDFSVDHPDLLNARFSEIDWTLKDCFAKNITNGLSKLLPVDRIDTVHYFERYQVALVLKGIGAAFRLSRHMMTRTAVLLQDCEVEEWFTKYLTPYVHYIPVSSDLSDLKEALVWIKNHPEDVQAIGENGRAFYERYLTFVQTDELIYELVYRLSEYRHHEETSGM